MNRIETELFVGTPLEQDTFVLYDPELVKEYLGSYSPYHLSAWMWRDRPNTQHISYPNMLLHEMGHVTETFVHGRPDRLLKNNYGYKSGRLIWPFFKRECWVFAMQSLFSADILGETFLKEEMLEATLTAFTKPKAGVECDMVTFKGLIQEASDEQLRNGVNYYYDAFQAACEWVKVNRT